MPEQTPAVGMARKLAAILSTDVAGYSRLMGDDEEATIRTLTAYRAVISSLVRHYRGRVVYAPDDNLLAEFASVVDVVRCTERQSPGAHSKRMGVLVLAGFVLVASSIAAVRYLSRSSLDTQHSSLLTEEAKPPALPLLDKPSLAVVPFTNMSGDPEQEYFNDGMTDILITDLSQLSRLFVIARNSVFIYKGSAVKVQEVGKELGMRYALEGSVQKANNRVRINVQLIDATTSGYVWAERFDRDLTDIFALQDEVTQQVVTALQVQRFWQLSSQLAILTKEDRIQVCSGGGKWSVPIVSQL